MISAAGASPGFGCLCCAAVSQFCCSGAAQDFSDWLVQCTSEEPWDLRSSHCVTECIALKNRWRPLSPVSCRLHFPWLLSGGPQFLTGSDRVCERCACRQWTFEVNALEAFLEPFRAAYPCAGQTTLGLKCEYRKAGSILVEALKRLRGALACPGSGRAQQFALREQYKYSF